MDGQPARRGRERQAQGGREWRAARRWPGAGRRTAGRWPGPPGAAGAAIRGARAAASRAGRRSCRFSGSARRPRGRPGVFRGRPRAAGADRAASSSSWRCAARGAAAPGRWGGAFPVAPGPGAAGGFRRCRVAGPAARSTSPAASRRPAARPTGRGGRWAGCGRRRAPTGWRATTRDGSVLATAWRAGDPVFLGEDSVGGGRPGGEPPGRNRLLLYEYTVFYPTRKAPDVSANCTVLVRTARPASRRDAPSSPPPRPWKGPVINPGTTWHASCLCPHVTVSSRNNVQQKEC